MLLLDALTGATLLAATGATSELAAGAEYALNEVVGAETGAADELAAGEEYALSEVVDVEPGAPVLTGAAELADATVLTGTAEDP